MSSSTVRTALATALKAVSKIGAVHDYDRFSNDPAKFFRKHFVRRGKINGWVFRVERLPSTVLTCSEDERHFRVIIRAWMSAVDDTETLKDAEDLRDSVCNTLDQNPTLSGSVTHADKAAPEDIVTGMTQFGEGNVLVHQITIRVVYHLRVAITYV